MFTNVTHAPTARIRNISIRNSQIRKVGVDETLVTVDETLVLVIIVVVVVVQGRV